MAQSINEIQSNILETAANAPEIPVIEVLTENEENTVGNITSTSKVGVFRLLIYIVAVAQWAQQKLNDIFRADIEERIAATRPFTQRWYVTTSLNYQHGYDLDEEGNYPVPGSVLEQQAVEASKIIAKAAVVQTIIAGVGALRVKVAKLSGDLLVPVTIQERAGFQEYIEQMGAAGIYVIATTSEADMLLLNYKIYFDPLILDSDGKRLDGTNDTPVQTAIKDYLKSVEFNGVLSLVKLNDIVQAVVGVSDPFIENAASKFGGFSYTDTNLSGNVGPITEFRGPDSGYFRLDEGASQFLFLPAN